MMQYVAAACAYLCSVAMLALLALSAMHRTRRISWYLFGAGVVGSAALVSAHKHLELSVIAMLLCLACVTVSAVTDLHCGYVFDRVTYVSLVAIAGISVWNGTIETAFLGAATGSGSLALLWLLTKRRGMGLGDVKLAAVVGCALDPASMLFALGVAFVIGAVIVLGAMTLGRIQRGQTVPFAPYIALGTVVSIFCRSFA